MRRVFGGLSKTGIVVLAGAMGLSGGAVKAQSKAVSDAQVEANVLRALAGAPELATQSIKTTTVYGTVTLSGSVTDEPARSLAETLASKALGVQKVVDELTLSDGSDGAARPNSAPAAQPDQTQGGSSQNQGSNPQLQSDGTMAPPENGQQTQGTQQPGYQQPAYQQPAYQQPGYQQPGYQQPGAQQPGYQQPGSQQQGYQPPGNQQPGGQNGAVDPRYGPAGPPPDVQYGQNQGGQPYQNGQNGPPIYRQPYRGAQYAQQQAPPPQYGGQEGGRTVTIPAGALVRMRLVENLTAKLIKAGTVFDGTVLNDVIADGEVAIPRGAAVQGTIVVSNPSGAVGGKGQLALSLTSVSLTGRNYPIVTDTWTHYGRDKTGQTVGSAIGLGGFGALIGALAGGGPGAAIGAVAGVGAGVGTSAAAGRHDVVVPAEAIISFHLVQPAGVTTVSQQEMDRLGYGVQQANLQRRPVAPSGYYGQPAYNPTPY